MSPEVLYAFFKEAGALSIATAPLKAYRGAFRMAPKTTVAGTAVLGGSALVHSNQAKAEEARRKAYPQPNRFQTVRRPNPVRQSQTGLY